MIVALYPQHTHNIDSFQLYTCYTRPVFVGGCYIVLFLKKSPRPPPLPPHKNNQPINQPTQSTNQSTNPINQPNQPTNQPTQPTQPNPTNPTTNQPTQPPNNQPNPTNHHLGFHASIGIFVQESLLAPGTQLKATNGVIFFCCWRRRSKWRAASNGCKLCIPPEIYDFNMYYIYIERGIRLKFNIDTQNDLQI